MNALCFEGQITHRRQGYFNEKVYMHSSLIQYFTFYDLHKDRIGSLSNGVVVCFHNWV